MNTDAAELDRYGFHRDAFFVTCDQQVADVDWTIRRIHFHFHAAGGGHEHAAFTVVDELNGESYPWRGPRNFVMLDPNKTPAHVFSIKVG